MKTKLISFATVIAFSLTGCAGLGGHAAFLSPNNPKDVYSKGELADNIKAHLKTVEGLERAYYTDNVAQQQVDRDQIANLMLSDMDELWRRFFTAYYGRAGLAKTFVEGSATGLTAAAAITTPAQAAKILSTTAAVMLGIGSAYEKDVLQNDGADVLLGQMEADRKQASLGIVTSLSKPVDQYGLAALESDLAEYALTMSVPHAVLALRGKTGQQASQVQNARFPITPATTTPTTTAPATTTPPSPAPAAATK